MKTHILIVLSFVMCLSAAGMASSDGTGSAALLTPPPPLTSRLQFTFDGGTPSLDMSKPASEKQVSMRKALLLSMLLPGAGQYYAGSKFRGQVFMGVEASIWAGFIAYRVYGGWRTDDYKSIAAAYAKVDNGGKDDEFYDYVGFYESRDEFNQFGRLYYPDRPYLPDTREYYWQWESESKREEFKNIKDQAKRAFRNSTLLIGLAVVNRVIAGIDTYRAVKSARKKVDAFGQFGDYRLRVKPDLFGSDRGVTVSLTRKF